MDMAAWYTDNLEQYYLSDSLKKDGVMFQNALNLLPSLRRRIQDPSNETDRPVDA